MGVLQMLDQVVVSSLERWLGTNTTYHYWIHQYWEQSADVRTKDFSFVDVSHTTICLLMALYALSAWVLIPLFMKNRQPYNLKRAIIMYDFFMVLMNAYFFVKSIQLSDWGRELFKLEDTTGDQSPRALAYIEIANLYYISKLIDMFDTIFMGFRKSYAQITFLHVWHHTSLSYAGWLYMKYNPYTPSILLIPFINSFIHVVMYGYYGLAALGPHMRKYLWWKKYITRIQLVQFTLVFLWYIYLYFFSVDLPIGYLMCNLCNSAFLFVLFTNFYIQSYRRQSRADSKKVKPN